MLLQCAPCNSKFDWLKEITRHPVVDHYLLYSSEQSFFILKPPGISSVQWQAAGPLWCPGLPCVIVVVSPAKAIRTSIQKAMGIKGSSISGKCFCLLTEIIPCSGILWLFPDFNILKYAYLISPLLWIMQLSNSSPDSYRYFFFCSKCICHGLPFQSGTLESTHYHANTLYNHNPPSFICMGRRAVCVCVCVCVCARARVCAHVCVCGCVVHLHTKRQLSFTSRLLPSLSGALVLPRTPRNKT